MQSSAPAPRIYLLIFIIVSVLKYGLITLVLLQVDRAGECPLRNGEHLVVSRIEGAARINFHLFGNDLAVDFLRNDAVQRLGVGRRGDAPADYVDVAAGLELEGQLAAALVHQLGLGGLTVLRQTCAVADLVEQLLGFGVAFAFGPDQGFGLHQHHVGIAQQAAVERVPEFVAQRGHLFALAVGAFPRGDELAADQTCRYVAGRVVRDASVGVVTAEGDVTAYELRL